MLSDSQQAAVDHTEGPCLVLAGPGSGKTHTLTERIASLVAREVTSPERILVITFTKAAALEMKERFMRRIGGESPVVFGTFHSVFYQILRQEVSYREYRLMDARMKAQILREVFVSCKMDVENEEALSVMEREVSFLKNTMCSPTEFSSAYFRDGQIARLFEFYEARKHAYHLFDFDDLLTETYTLFQEDPQVLARWQKRFSYLLLDEVQDMNALQFAIVQLLAQPHENIFAVGDDDQSIYAFRGSDPSIMLRFAEVYPTTKQILLAENFRCAETILTHSLRLISQNQTRFDKKICGMSKSAGALEVISCEDDVKEAETVIAHLIKRHKEGIAWEEMAILYRNHEQSEHVIALLEKMRLPYFVRDRLPNPYTHFVVCDILSYLRLHEKMLHRRDLFRIMNRPERGLMRASIEREWVTFSSWKNFYHDQPQMVRIIDALEVDVGAMRKMSAFAAVMYIRKKMGYEKYLRASADDTVQWEQWSESLDFITSLAKTVRTVPQFLALCEENKERIDRLNANKEKERGARIGLYSLHGAKGLEFDTVVILDCNEKIVPSKKATTDAMVEEERRLFYVGMTRAKEALLLCYVTSRRGKKMLPSRFLSEMQREES